MRILLDFSSDISKPENPCSLCDYQEADVNDSFEIYCSENDAIPCCYVVKCSLYDELTNFESDLDDISF